jgi:hypothetical protein
VEKVGGSYLVSSHGRDNQPSVYGWNRRWPLRVRSVSPLRVRSVSGEGGGKSRIHTMTYIGRIRIWEVSDYSRASST